MKRIFLIAFIILFLKSYGQDKIEINGRILDDFLSPLPGVQIQTADTLLITTSDMEGRFKFKIDPGNNKVIFAYIGMELTPVTFNENCRELEIILLSAGTHCFATPKKVDRLRKRQFNKRAKMHKSAFESGLFVSEKSCANPEFVPHFK